MRKVRYKKHGISVLEFCKRIRFGHIIQQKVTKTSEMDKIEVFHSHKTGRQLSGGLVTSGSHQEHQTITFLFYHVVNAFHFQRHLMVQRRLLELWPLCLSPGQKRSQKDQNFFKKGVVVYRLCQNLSSFSIIVLAFLLPNPPGRKVMKYIYSGQQCDQKMIRYSKILILSQAASKFCLPV